MADSRILEETDILQTALSQLRDYGLQIAVMLSPPAVNPCFISQINQSEIPDRPPPPFVSVERCKPGIDVEMMEETCNYLGIQNRTYVLVNHTELGGRVNGSWRGIVAQVGYGEFDTSVPFLVTNGQRREILSFSDHYYEAPLMFATRYASVAEFPFLSLQVFQAETWGLIVISALLIAFLLPCASLIQKPIRTPPLTYVRRHVKNVPFLDTINVFLAQGSNLRIEYAFGKIAMGIWALAVVALAGTFTGNLLSLLLMQGMRPPYSNLATLATCIKDHRCQLVVYSLLTAFMSLITDPNATRVLTVEERQLQEALLINPPVVVPIPDMIDYVFTHKSAGVFSVVVATAEDFQAAHDKRYCSLYKIMYRSTAVAAGFSLNNSAYGPLFSRAKDALIRGGVIQGILKRYSIDVCSLLPEGAQALPLGPVVGSFLQLAIGLSTAIVCFLIELAYGRTQKVTTRFVNAWIWKAAFAVPEDQDQKEKMDDEIPNKDVPPISILHL